MFIVIIFTFFASIFAYRKDIFIVLSYRLYYFFIFLLQIDSLIQYASSKVQSSLTLFNLALSYGQFGLFKYSDIKKFEISRALVEMPVFA